MRRQSGDALTQANRLLFQRYQWSRDLLPNGTSHRAAPKNPARCRPARSPCASRSSARYRSLTSTPNSNDFSRIVEKISSPAAQRYWPRRRSKRALVNRNSVLKRDAEESVAIGLFDADPFDATNVLNEFYCGRRRDVCREEWGSAVRCMAGVVELSRDVGTVGGECWRVKTLRPVAIDAAKRRAAEKSQRHRN